jgi:hypothetical protein
MLRIVLVAWLGRGWETSGFTSARKPYFYGVAMRMGAA